MTAPAEQTGDVLSSELPKEPIPLRVTTSFEAFVAEVEPGFAPASSRRMAPSEAVTRRPKPSPTPGNTGSA